MNDAVEYKIGAPVACSDGVCGELSRVVLDPVARALTHLVVKPSHKPGLARLVPIDLAEPGAQEVRLRCSTAEFDALEDAEETRFLPEVGAQLGYEPGEALAWPYYPLGTGIGIGGLGMGGLGMADVPQSVTFDRIPVGEVEVLRGEHVHATDGPIGQIQGLVIDRSDHHVTHVLLQEGHLWGRKQVAIPISDVTEVTPDGVQLKLSREQVRELPPVDLADRD
jgi:sporulation protein YlmC with PRC-barrel domain